MRNTVEQELLEQGKDPNDFNIVEKENTIIVTPKWFYENKQIAKKEDKPIITDVNDIAGTVAYNLVDVNDLAETLALTLVEMDNLKAEINLLKGV